MRSVLSKGYFVAERMIARPLFLLCSCEHRHSFWSSVGAHGCMLYFSVTKKRHLRLAKAVQPCITCGVRDSDRL